MAVDCVSLESFRLASTAPLVFDAMAVDCVSLESLRLVSKAPLVFDTMAVDCVSLESLRLISKGSAVPAMVYTVLTALLLPATASFTLLAGRKTSDAAAFGSSRPGDPLLKIVNFLVSRATLLSSASLTTLLLAVWRLSPNSSLLRLGDLLFGDFIFFFFLSFPPRNGDRLNEGLLLSSAELSQSLSPSELYFLLLRDRKNLKPLLDNVRPGDFPPSASLVVYPMSDTLPSDNIGSGFFFSLGNTWAGFDGGDFWGASSGLVEDRVVSCRLAFFG
mmetsp:Transcript_28995/g.52532  ORF Transcript_28995/g.52532 Transcript_28995/m.52532 type:complete len:275 (+) Transcript_28995:1317-2141(+)